MTAAYYAWSTWVLNFPAAAETRFWVLASLGIAAPLAVVVQICTRGHGLFSALPIALIGAIAATDGAPHAVWLQVRGLMPPDAPSRLPQAAVDMISALAIVMLMRNTRTRLLALLLLVPGLIATLLWAGWLTDHMNMLIG